MMTGLAGGLLVFTGFWHATEWLMDGRRRDTLILIPFGLLYLFLGYLLVTVTGGTAAIIAAIVVPAIGGALAFLNLGKSNIRRWVTWTFIILDAVIVLALILALIG